MESSQKGLTKLSSGAIIRLLVVANIFYVLQLAVANQYMFNQVIHHEFIRS